MSYHVNHQSDAIDASTPIMRSSSRISPLSVDHDHKFQRSRGFFNVEKSGSGKEGYFRRHSMRGGSRTSTPESDYGAVEDWDDLDDEDIAVNLEDDMTIADDGSAIPPRFSMQFGGLKREPNPRRWSVMEKLNRRYYCRIRSCDELTKIVNGKCLFSTLMLFVFIFLLYLVIRAVFFNKTFEPQTYDFIIIGAGPAGSVLTRKLLDSGARVLLLEAGNVTQYDLGGVGYSGSPLTVFDIPLLWTAALKFPDHTWSFLPETSNEMKQLSHKKGNKKKSDQVDYLKTVDGSSDVNFDRIGLHPIIPKGLGGGGSMNAMVYTTALESDIKRWNIPKITWKLMNETYRDLEAFYDIRIGKSTVDGRRNIGSEIISSFYTDELSKQFIESAMAAGIPYNEDFNNPNSIRNGAGYYQFRIKNGVRSSAAQTMLGPLIRSKQPVPGFNFEVEAEVKRVLLVNMDSSSVTSTGKTVGKNGKTNSFNKEGNHYYYSYGVEYEVNGIRKTALLGQSTSTYNKLKKFEGSRSVIVSAGAIMTPKLLMDSGIGDPDTLQNANIVPLVNNRNVGKNLQDHPAVQVVLQPSARLQASYPTSYTLAQQWMNYFSAVETLKSLEEAGIQLDTQQQDSWMDKIGVLGSTGFSVGAFLTSPYSTSSTPDIQVTVYPTMELVQTVSNNRYDVNSVLSKQGQKGPVVVLTVALLDSNMRYNVSICTTRGIQYPCVQEETAPDELDIGRLLWGVMKMREVLVAGPFANSIEKELVPGNFYVNETLKDWIRLTVSPSSHWTSSCRMGLDPMDSALDSQFNVRGVKGLKVVDASTIPFVPNGNIGATVTAFASVAADIIAGTA